LGILSIRPEFAQIPHRISARFSQAKATPQDWGHPHSG
jgi:hypothetical protein